LDKITEIGGFVERNSKIFDRFIFIIGEILLYLYVYPNRGAPNNGLRSNPLNLIRVMPAKGTGKAKGGFFPY
jgi:hypothetical protein